MKRLKTRLLANRRKAKLKAKRKRQRARATGLAVLALLGLDMSLAGCGPQAQPSAPYSQDCLRVYSPACGNPIRYDPIRDGHGG